MSDTDQGQRVRKNVALWRVVCYHLGQLLILLGIIAFLSIFIVLFNVLRELFDSAPRVSVLSPGRDGLLDTLKPLLWAPAGIVSIFLGRLLMVLARRGIAGSGIVLDPQWARRDEEPFNRSKGGMAQDTIDEIPSLLSWLHGIRSGSRQAESRNVEPAVRIRCRECRSLNDETDKFCGQCGGEL